MTPPLPDGVCLLASVCNTTPGAAAFALWIAHHDQQYVVDLSDVLGPEGDGGVTGLAWHNGMLHCAVQSGNARILLLDRTLKPIGAIQHPAFADLHSLHATDDGLLVVSTGNETLLRLDPATQAVTSLYESIDETHVNSACVDDSSHLICYHARPGQDRQMRVGGVMNVASRRVLLEGLGMPHSLLPYHDGFAVLDSIGSRVIRFDRSGILAEQPLPGFLRGATVANDTLFVGSSTVRYISRSRPEVPPTRGLWQAMQERVRIYALDAATLDVRAIYEPALPGFEIYDLLAIDAAAIEPAAERLLQPRSDALSQLFYYEAKRAYAALHAHVSATPDVVSSDGNQDRPSD